MTSRKFICIHSHFYQPPRENPWLEAIDYQESARPFHDWNERVNAECYRPNGQSRIMDDEGRVARLTNNYSRINFNFGPTLLSWIEEHDPETYQAILGGDKKSRERSGGHGSAIAQAYNHMILPLASRRDKETQIKWGLRDFESRFKRNAEALWLPETAVDLETLEICADHGMKYVILAPHQAVCSKALDSRQPYRINLPGGKSIAAFFYDGALSQAVAFEGLLNNGEIFARRLIDGFDQRTEPQLLHIATDGESYGHHHRYGDMALAYALDYIGKKDTIHLTNYSQYLANFPPQLEAGIHEKSSWSCAHGVERWRNDCGCNTGMRQNWQQQWRRPLREAVDMLRDTISTPYESFLSAYTDDPWGMRNDYIELLLSRSDKVRRDYFNRWLKKEIPAKDEQAILKALESQRNLMFSHTSCAWFFDEISGTEAVQNMLYAARAIELARDVLGYDDEGLFVEILRRAPSNIPEFGDGAHIYENLALPAGVSAPKVAAHLGASALFHDKLKDGRFYCFHYEWKEVERLYAGKAQLICAHISLTSDITQETKDVEFVAIHLGDHNINVGALPYDGHGYKDMSREFIDIFERGDVARCLRTLDKYFGDNIFSLNDFFRDQRKEIIDIVFSNTLEDVEEKFLNLYHENYPVMRYLFDIHVALPPVFYHIAHFVLGREIENELANENIDTDAMRRHIEEAREWNVEMDSARIEKRYIRALNRLFPRIMDVQILQKFVELLTVQKLFPFSVDLSGIQSVFSSWLFQNLQSIPEENHALLREAADILRISWNEGVNSA